ncbi:hypothetical protein [Microvirga makkahensis]|uniref:hypothetical protein n=1 Tax=Microvirga makkahensis TaxID=1128670 RepID=UPI00197B38DA|nr:hypothetical protein [Microvirga makkahensis]
MLRRLIVLGLVLSSPAFAQSYTRSDIVRGLCQPDGCDEFTVLRADRIAAGEEGTLLKTRVRTFHASSAGRQERGEQGGYVFCSPTKPALIAERDGRTMAFYLAPFTTLESRETIRRNTNFHALYFSICHGPEAGRAAVHNLSGAARDLGYRVSLVQSKTEPLTRADDILAATGRPPVTAGPSPGMNAELTPRPTRPQPAAPNLTVGGGEHPVRPHAGSATVTPKDDGIMAGPRQLTNRMFDALDEVGEWVLGR